jgi:hypothetical protein
VRHLTPPEFSSLLWDEYRIKRTVDTLAKLRCIGGSAPFIKAGRAVLYPEQPGRAWALALLSPLKTSTSDTGAQAA